ncbi:hypothetical protein NDU88_006033 [Pleurodeles waltl]|uniref:Uncharacterized protein n=1 Tax=Pleurodeles waltl TaxID=8319 RepID=A0AAV7VKR8_PLEWA|nr:hypothetical protein NDU88_006033 [Pleurodeles waltl]
MERTRRLACRTSCCSLVIFLRTQSNFLSICEKAAGSMAAAGMIWVPAEEVWARVVAMSVGCPAGGAVLGPGAVAVDGPAKVPAAVGATWVVVVVVLVLVVAVVDKEGPPCANALQAPEARSWRYLQTMLQYPDSTSSMWRYLIARH